MSLQILQESNTGIWSDQVQRVKCDEKRYVFIMASLGYCRSFISVPHSLVLVDL